MPEELFTQQLVPTFTWNKLFESQAVPNDNVIRNATLIGASLERGTYFEVKGKFKIGGLVMGVDTTDSIQNAIDEVNAEGGGTVIIKNGTHKPKQDITLYSSVYLEGQNESSSIIDFENGAYGIKAIGTNAYTTGTIAITAGTTTVTGTSTVWTSDMVDRGILLSGIWYTISSVDTAAQTLEISLPFAGGADLSGASYTIASYLYDIRIKDLTIQNSTTSAVKLQYVNEVEVKFITFITCTIGIDSDTVSNLGLDNLDTAYCGTGFSLTDSHFFAVEQCGLIDSTTKGGEIISSTNFVILNDFFLNSTGNGLELTSCSTALISGCASKGNGDNGIELISGNNYIQIASNNLENNTNDGISLTATDDYNVISNNQLITNSGYGINIAASTCDNNYVGPNLYQSNTLGMLNDSGTNTIQASSNESTKLKSYTVANLPNNRVIKSAGTGADDSTVGTTIWQTATLSKITASDNDYATTEDMNNGNPANNVQIENSMKIVKGGVISGDEKSTGATIPEAEATKTYGSSSDLWGLTWTATNINASDFGFVYSVKNTGSLFISHYLKATNFGFVIPTNAIINGIEVLVEHYDPDWRGSVDHIQIRVYYTDPDNPNVTAGMMLYASNGRKAGEGVGAGTGVAVFYDANNKWVAVDTGAEVAA